MQKPEKIEQSKAADQPKRVRPIPLAERRRYSADVNEQNGEPVVFTDWASI